MQLGISPDHVTFKLGNTTIFSKVISGQYPNYERVIPTDNDKTVIADVDVLNAAIRRSSIFANQHSRQIKWNLEPNSLTVLAEDQELGGDSRETLPVEYDGDSMLIGYNASYLSEILRHVDTEQVNLRLKDPGSAMLIEPIPQEKGVDCLMLLMPIRLNE